MSSGQELRPWLRAMAPWWLVWPLVMARGLPEPRRQLLAERPAPGCRSARPQPVWWWRAQRQWLALAGPPESRESLGWATSMRRSPTPPSPLEHASLSSLTRPRAGVSRSIGNGHPRVVETRDRIGLGPQAD